MNRTPLVFTVVIAAGAIASLFLCYRTKADLQEKDALLRQQKTQQSKLAAQNARLSNQLANADPNTTNAAAELARLRGKLEILRQQTNTLAQSKEDRDAISPAELASRRERTQKYLEEVNQSIQAWLDDGCTLGRAFYDFAKTHENQAPANLDQVSSILATSRFRWSGTNQFEFIYQGSFDDLKGIPLRSVAVVRSQPWIAPDGVERRVYGFPDGHALVLTSDWIPSWEKEHVFLIAHEQK